MKNNSLFTILFIIFNFNILSQESLINVETVRDDLFSPWEILEATDGNLWFTEKLGTIWRVNPDTGEKKRIGVIDSVYNNFERGLLGMVLHPNFPERPWVYLVYTTLISGDEYYNRLVRMEYKNDSLINYERFLQTQGNYVHNGSRLKFSPDGYLFMTMGEIADHNRAQNLNEWEGKIFKMDENCQPLSSNPYFNHGSEAAKYIYSYAHRNPQGLVFANGKIYSTEHGPDTDDELNIIREGGHYGWPRVKGFCDTPEEEEYCDEHQVIEPLFAWTPTVAVSGIDYYSGERFPMFQNSILMTTLKNATLHVMSLNDSGDNVISENTFLSGEYGRLRDVLVTSDDRIFVISSNGDWHETDENFRNDKILELKPNTNSVDFNNEHLSVYPNPVKNFLNIYIDNYKPKNIIVYDYLGNEVLNLDINTNPFTLNTSTLKSGIYFIQLETVSGEILKEKFLKN